MSVAIRPMFFGMIGLVVVLSGCDPTESEAEPGQVSESAACPSDAEIDRFLADWHEAQPAQAVAAGGTFEDAFCAQQKLLDRLIPTLGNPVGFKAGLTSQAAQETFGVTEPVRGVLLEGMLLDDGAEIPVDFGARPRFEADIIVVVSDNAINDATTIEEVLANLSEVVPFIEVPDLAVSEDEPLDGVILTAVNVAARLGVVGDPIPVQQTPEFLQALADMTVRLVDGSGEELVSTPGSAILGHPLNSVLWLMESGLQLSPGDQLSLGSFGPLLIPEAGQSATLHYEGLPGNPTASVSFY